MKTPKHTPTPWHTHKNDDCVYAPVYGGNGEVIDSVVIASHVAPDDRPLIAAAPAMYDTLVFAKIALEETIAEYNEDILADGFICDEKHGIHGFDVPGYVSECLHAISDINEILAKARGES